MAQDHHVPVHARMLSKPGVNENAALGIDFLLIAVQIHRAEKLLDAWVIAPVISTESVFDEDPFGQGVEPHGRRAVGGQEDLGAESLEQDIAKLAGDFEPPLFVDPGVRAAPEHGHPL